MSVDRGLESRFQTPTQTMHSIYRIASVHFHLLVGSLFTHNCTNSYILRFNQVLGVCRNASKVSLNMLNIQAAVK